MPDWLVIRIPMAYAMPCETLRFASRNERFVLPVFQPRRRAKRNGAAGAGPCPSEGQTGGIALAATHRAGSDKPVRGVSAAADKSRLAWRRRRLKDLEMAPQAIGIA